MTHGTFASELSKKKIKKNGFQSTGRKETPFHRSEGEKEREPLVSAKYGGLGRKKHSRT